MTFPFLSACGVLLGAACLLGAQDWRTAESLPGIDFGSLKPEQKATALKILRDRDCSCGCSKKLAECRVVDPTCSYSTGLAKAVIEALAQGKSEADARAAADASRWAHVQAPKLLEDPVQIPIAGAPSMGPENARVTLIEFSDFQCPYCAAAVPEIRALLNAYPTQVRLIFKEFPLEIHRQADLAAAAAVAAQKQGKFWPMHDAMYAARGALSRQNVLALAATAGLDVKKFEDDLDSTEVRESVVRDVQDGTDAGVEGTPTLFINGQKYNGPIALSQLKPVLDGQLRPATAQAKAQ
jgi:protein-disulfide isomerase